MQEIWTPQERFVLGDTHVILVASSHLRDAAVLWWDSVEEDRVTTSLEFKEQFELKFASETQRASGMN